MLFCAAFQAAAFLRLKLDEGKVQKVGRTVLLCLLVDKPFLLAEGSERFICQATTVSPWSCYQFDCDSDLEHMMHSITLSRPFQEVQPFTQSWWQGKGETAEEGGFQRRQWKAQSFGGQPCQRAHRPRQRCHFDKSQWAWKRRKAFWRKESQKESQGQAEGALFDKNWAIAERSHCHHGHAALNEPWVSGPLWCQVLIKWKWVKRPNSGFPAFPVVMPRTAFW